MSNSYYLYYDKKKSGPFTISQLKSKGITEEMLIWRTGLNKWVKPSDLEETANLIMPTPPPTPDELNENRTGFQKIAKFEKAKTIAIKTFILSIFLLTLITWVISEMAAKGGGQDNPIFLTKELEQMSHNGRVGHFFWNFLLYLLPLSFPISITSGIISYYSKVNNISEITDSDTSNHKPLLFNGNIVNIIEKQAKFQKAIIINHEGNIVLSSESPSFAVSSLPIGKFTLRVLTSKGTSEMQFEKTKENGYA